MIHRKRWSGSAFSLAVLMAALPFVGQKPPKAATPMVRSGGASAADCSAPASALPARTTRVYVALRNGHDGSGKSPDDGRDGSSVERFDRVLRCYSEGCSDPDPKKAVARTENLIVCLGPGKFETKGQYDFMVNVPHRRPEGFTLGKGWRVHGAGVDRTTVQLAAYYAPESQENPQNLKPGTAQGVVFATNSDNASGIEISDLTVDANYPALKPMAWRAGIRALNLDAIQLRSDYGGHWIHDVHVLHNAGEITEAFPVWIVSMRLSNPPTENNSNLIERVRMSGFGGGQCTGIAVANAVAEVRNNTVDGLQIGYGGWIMGPVWFHDNTAANTDYGFNVDSLANRDVRIEANQIVHPRKYGIVVGGRGTYAGFTIAGNTIRIDKAGVVGVLFRGNVTGAVVIGNSIVAEGGVKATAVRSYAGELSAGPNVDNVFESNRISKGLRAEFKGLSWQQRSCIHGNLNEQGGPSQDLADNHAGPCLGAK
ncbi:MAG TPA: hypothetical protein VFL42_04990 [Terriglobales bacterium]|nr:hypothetical protein [Terriglobales bacterium]